MAFGFRKSIVSQTRNITKEIGKAHLICHDGKCLATLLPSVGNLVTLGKCLHQRHVHSVFIRVFTTGDLAAYHI